MHLLSTKNESSFKRKRSADRALLVALMVAMMAFAVVATMPIASAHTPPWKMPRFAYIIGTPNPAGVNQDTLLVFWVNTVPPTAEGAYGDRWTNYMLNITKPDGTKQSLGPFTSDPVGSCWTLYKPDQTGIYKIVFSCADQVVTGKNPSGQIYPGKTINQITGAVSVNDTYLAATSDPLYLNVTTAQVQPWKEAPLPTNYWTRPVNNMNRNWEGLLGNWLAGSAQRVGPTTNFAYGPSVNTPHVMWTKQYTDGGIMDQRFGDIGFYTGLSYEGFGLSPPVIIDGRLYYSWRVPPRMGWYAVDLYTGETLYYKNTTGPVSYDLRSDSSGALLTGDLSFGQVLNYDSPNQHGGLAYLWSTSGPSDNWVMYDAVTGNPIIQIANVSATGTQVYGKDGSILYYNLAGSGANRRLTIWNTTRAVEMYYGNDVNSSTYIRNYFWVWRPILNSVVNGRLGFSLNVSIGNVPGSILWVEDGNMVVIGSAGSNDGVNVTKGTMCAINLDPKKQAVGSILWNISFTPPSSAGFSNEAISTSTGSPLTLRNVDVEDGMFFFSNVITRQMYGYSLTTGNQMWVTPSIEAFNYYGMTSNVYRGTLFVTGYGGVLHAYNATTGKEIWNYTAANMGFESPYGNYPLSIGAIADNTIYLYSTEHSPTMPLWRGSCVRAVDISTGKENWKILTWASGIAISDGNLITLNLYDNQIYCFGKGPSATTVTATPGLGNVITIQGSVTDQSPGAKSKTASGEQTMMPAISDADQEAWMEYVYEQQAMPANAKGVPVTIYVSDQNGKVVDTKTTTSDISGHYAIQWTPPAMGIYTITASFEGTNAYYGSTQETSIAIGPSASAAPATTTPPPTAPASPTSAPTQTTAPTQTPAQTNSPTPKPVVEPPTSNNYTALYIGIAAIVIIAGVIVAAFLLRRQK